MHIEQLSCEFLLGQCTMEGSMQHSVLQSNVFVVLVYLFASYLLVNFVSSCGL